MPPDIAHHEVHKVIQPWGSQDDGIPPCKKNWILLSAPPSSGLQTGPNWPTKVVQFALPSCPNRQGVRFSPVHVF